MQEIELLPSSEQDNRYIHQQLRRYNRQFMRDFKDYSFHIKQDGQIVAGIVAALNATVGSAVTDSVVATIQDTDALKIAITVEEYDIASLQVGLPVIITSDATGDTALRGPSARSPRPPLPVRRVTPDLPAR